MSIHKALLAAGYQYNHQNRPHSDGGPMEPSYVYKLKSDRSKTVWVHGDKAYTFDNSSRQRGDKVDHKTFIKKYLTPVKESKKTSNINKLFEAKFALKKDPKKKPPVQGDLKPAIIIHGKFGEEKDSNSAVFKSLEKKASASGIGIEVLGEVYDRGIDSWNESLNITPQQHAFARVNSFISQGKTYFEEDADLVESSSTQSTINNEVHKKFKADNWEGPFSIRRRSDGGIIDNARQYKSKSGNHNKAVDHLKDMGFNQSGADATGHSEDRGNYRISYLYHPHTKTRATVTTEHGAPLNVSIFHPNIKESKNLDELSTYAHRNYRASAHDQIVAAKDKPDSDSQKVYKKRLRGYMNSIKLDAKQHYTVKKIDEKHLMPNELKKREEIAQAIEREHPGMDKAKKMAIATANAKHMAEGTINYKKHSSGEATWEPSEQPWEHHGIKIKFRSIDYKGHSDVTTHAEHNGNIIPGSISSHPSGTHDAIRKYLAKKESLDEAKLSSDLTTKPSGAGNHDVYWKGKLTHHHIFNGSIGLSGRGNNVYGIFDTKRMKIAKIRGTLSQMKKALALTYAKNDPHEIKEETLDEISSDMIGRAAAGARKKSMAALKNKDTKLSIKKAHQAGAFDRESLHRSWGEQKAGSETPPVEEAITSRKEVETSLRPNHKSRKDVELVGRPDSDKDALNRQTAIRTRILETVRLANKKPVIIPAHYVQKDPAQPPVLVPAKVVAKRTQTIQVSQNKNPNDGK